MKNTRSKAVRELAQGTFDLRLQTPYQCLSFVLALVMLVQPLAVPLAFAEPQGENPVSGTAAFNRDVPNLTTITTSDRVIIEYSSFDILAGETVQFIQPEVTSAALNRILSAVPTNIDGTLQANGRVYLVNPAGVIFGAGSVVDVGQIFAAAGSMSNEDFNANLNQFTGVEGDVQNLGAIEADVVALIGRAVSNTGTITATDGLVVLAAGSNVLIGDPSAGIFVAFTPEAAAGSEAGPGVSNTGSIDAGPTGGRVLLAASDLYALAFQQSGPGSVTAETVQVQAEDGAVEIGGTVDATNLIAQSGGDVTLEAAVTLDGGTLHLEADSPHRTGGADGAGTVALADNVNAVTGNGSATLIGADFDLGTGATVEAGTGNINVARSRSDIPLVLGSATGAQLDDGELAALTTTGTLQLGFATTAGGAQIGAQNLTAGAITRAAGSLFLVGRDTVDLNGDIDVDAGNLGVSGPITASGNLVASGDVTLQPTPFVLPSATLTLDGADQRIEAQSGTLSVFADLEKTTAGDLNLAGGAGIALSGDLQTTGAGATDALVLEDAVTLNGDDQRIDALFGSLTTAGVTKSSPGSLSLAGDAGVVLGGEVNAPSLTVQSSGDVEIQQDLTIAGALQLEADSPVRSSSADGAGTLTFDANANAVAGSATLIAADFDLGAGSSVDAGAGAINVARSRNADALAIGTAAGAQLGDGELAALATTGTLTLGRATVTGGAVTLAAEDLTAGPITRAAGSLALAGTTAVTLDDTIDVDAGNLTVDGPFTATGNLVASNDVTLNGSGTLDGVDQRIDAEAGTLDVNGNLVKVTPGDLELGGATALSLAGNVRTPGVGATDALVLEDDATLDGADQRVDAVLGSLVTAGLDKSTAGRLNLGGDAGVRVGGAVAANSLVVQSAGNVRLEQDVALAGGALNLEADSPNRLGGGDGVGTLTIDPDANVTTGGGATLIAADFELGAGSSVDAGAGALAVTRSSQADPLALGTAAGAQLDDAELDTLTTTGTVTLGRATTFGIDDEGNGVVTLTSENVNVDGVTLAAPNVALVASDEIAGDADAAADVTTGALTLEADAVNGLAVADVSTLSIVDTGPGAIGVTVTRTPTPDALTSVDVRGLGNGDIDIAFTDGVNPTPTGTVEVDDNLVVQNVNVDHDFTFIGQGGPVTLNTIATPGTLTVNAGANAIVANGALGGTTPLGGVDLTGSAITLQDVATTGDQSYTAGTINVASAYVSAGNIEFGGDLVLNSNTTVDAGEDAVFGGTVETDGVGAWGLDVDAGSDASFAGDVGDDGGANVLGQLTVAADDGIEAQADLRASEGIALADDLTLSGAGAQRVDAGAGTLDANASIDKTTAGNLDLGGNADVLLGGDVQTTGATGADALSIEDPATLDAIADQRIDAGLGTLRTAALAKTNGDDLVLAGATAIDLNGTVATSGDDLVIEDAFSASGDLTSTGGITLQGAATLDGGDQRVDATGVLDADASITKTTGGDLNLAGGGAAIRLGGDVVATGASGDDVVTLENAVTLDGAAQRIDAGAGTLDADASITKTSAGNLNLGGAAAIVLGGDVEATLGSVTVENAFTASGDLLGGQNVSLEGEGTLDGASTQRIEAGADLGTLALTKAVADLELAGGASILLGGDVGATLGSVRVVNAFTASGDITAGGAVDLGGDGTLDGATTQRIAAGDTVDTRALTKATGNLELAGGILVLVGDVEATAGSLSVENEFSAYGNLLGGQDVTLGGDGVLNIPGLQRIAAGGNLSTRALEKSAGELQLAGADSILLDGDVEVASLSVENAFTANGNLLGSQNVTLAGDGTLGGGAPQRIAADGNLSTRALDKANSDLALAGGSSILLGGDVEATLGSVTVENTFTASGDVTAGNDVNLQGDGTLDGAATQRIAAGDRLRTGALTKATGDLQLAGASSILLAGSIEATAGSLSVENGFTASGDLLGSENVTLEGDGTLNGATTQRIAAGDNLSTRALSKATGDVELAGADSILLGGDVGATLGSVTVDNDFTASGDLTATNDVLLQGDGTLTGAAAQRISAFEDLRTRALTKASSDLTLGGGSTILLDGDVSATAGSVTVEDDFTASGDLVGGQNVTLQGEGSLNGFDTQRIEAGANLRTLALGKAAGELQLAGAGSIELGGDVQAISGSVSVENAFSAAGNLLGGQDVTLEGDGTLNGAALQRIAAGNDLSTLALTKAMGDLQLAGADSILLDGDVEATSGFLAVQNAFSATGDLLSGQLVSLGGDGTLFGGEDQRIDARTGTVIARGLTKEGTGNLALGGDADIELSGTVDVGAGSLTIDDEFDASGNLIANQNVSLAENGRLNGSANQTIQAETGSLDAAGTLLKIAPGNLTLTGGTDVQLADDVTVTSGALSVNGPFAATGDLLATTGATFANDGTLDGEDQRIDAGTGLLLAVGNLTKSTTGDLVLAGTAGINIRDVQATGAAATDTLRIQNSAFVAAGDRRIDAGAGTLHLVANLDKQAAGNLALGGDAGITAGGNVGNQGGNLTVENATTFVGGDQFLIAFGSGVLDANADLVKNSPGDLTVQGVGGLSLGGNVTAPGAVGGDLLLIGAASLDGADQIVDAGAGTLNLSGLTKTTAGNLALGGDTQIQLSGNVTTDGAQAANTLAITDEVLLSGGAQRIDARAGRLTARETLSSSAPGLLSLGGDAGIDLEGLVNHAGSVAVEDAFSTANSFLAGDSVTLLGAGTFDGANQGVVADTGTLDANGDLTKTTPGDLILEGASALRLAGDVTMPGATGGSTLRLDNAATLDGASQRLDAGAGSLVAFADVDKTTAGNLSLGGDAAIQLSGDLMSSSASDEDTLSLEDTASFMASVDQQVNAGAGRLVVQENLAKSSAGDFSVIAGTTIEFDGAGEQVVSGAVDDVTLDAGLPDSEFSSIFKETGDLTIDIAGGSGGVTTVSKVSVADGDLTIDAPGGTVNISDLTARGVLSVNASSINLTSRDRGPSFEITGKEVNDFDADFVGSRIDFSVAPTGRGEFVFGTPTGTEVNAPIQNSQYLKRALSTAGIPLTRDVFADASGSVRDLTPAGGSTTDPASDIAAVLADLAIAPTAPSLADASAEGQTRADDVLIFLECFPLEGQTEELPESCDAEEYGVAATGEATPPVGAPAATPAAVAAGVAVAPALGSAARPATTPQMNALRIYRDLRAKPVVPVLEDAVADYKSATGATEVKGADFRRYVETNPSQAEAVGYLNSMRSMVGELRQAGMTPAQFLRAAQQVVGEMTPAGISPAELGVAIEAGGQAGWPPLDLEQEEVAELLGDASR